jgi:hypothetical protein
MAPEKPRARKAPRSWDALTPSLPQWILDYLSAMGFEQPTPVQKSCLEIFRGNKDVVVEAVTGSGKTLAFLLPVVEVRVSCFCTILPLGGVLIRLSETPKIRGTGQATPRPRHHHHAHPRACDPDPQCPRITHQIPCPVCRTPTICERRREAAYVNRAGHRTAAPRRWNNKSGRRPERIPAALAQFAHRYPRTPG